MSVGKAGYGAVLNETDFGLSPCISSEIQSGPTLMFAPACSSLLNTESKISGRVSLT